MTLSDTDRRAHKRFDLDCPIVVADSTGRELFRARAVNVSNGGVLIDPIDPPAENSRQFHLNLRIPRATDNSFMYEDFFVSATIVRRNGSEDSPTLAMQFTEPIKLDLDD